MAIKAHDTFCALAASRSVSMCPWKNDGINGVLES